MPMLHRESDEFDERNLFLQVLLGLLSLAERLDAALARDAPEPVPAGADRVGSGTPHALDLGLLGAIATSRSLREQLAGVLSASPEAPPSAVAEVSPPGPDTLRRLLE